MNNMEFLIPIAMFLILGWIVKILSDNRLRHKIVDKGLSGEDLHKLFPAKTEQPRLSSLKWGMVFIALGLAFLLGQLGPEYMMEELTVGGMFLFSGVALLIYYVIATKYFIKEE